MRPGNPRFKIEYMYYFFFIIIIFSGLFFGIVVFLWALKSGQFKEQQRARYLPLEDEPEAPHKEISRSSKLQTFVLFGILIFGLVASASVIVYAFVI
jgi:cbb3-type cytochrome oxidase maturation protein